MYSCQIFSIFCQVLAVSVLYCAHLCTKCSLGISNFLEEIFSLSHSIVFFYFFALFTWEVFLISPGRHLNYPKEFVLCSSGSHTQSVDVRHLWARLELGVSERCRIWGSTLASGSLNQDLHFSKIPWLILSTLVLEEHCRPAEPIRVCVSHALVSESLWPHVHQAPLSMEFSRREYWSGMPFPSPGKLPDPGIAGRLFINWATGKTCNKKVYKWMS